jgi:predicted permease
MTIQGRERISTNRDVNLNSISPGFFKTLGIKMVAGRSFDQHDTPPPGETGERSAIIVNEAFVKRYLGRQNPIGVRICQGSGPDAKPDIPIVGVVSDFVYRDLRENSEQAYFSFLEGESSAGNFYVKVRGTAEEAFRTLRKIVHNADPALPTTELTTINEQVDQSLNTEHLLAALSGGFGALALLLSLVGLYGVMAFVVTQRTRETGIRVALGAKRSSTIWLVLRDALTMVLFGIAAGLPFVWALGRLIKSQLFEVKPSDPAALVTAILVLSLAASGAASVPAHRAAAVNPTDALRAE